MQSKSLVIAPEEGYTPHIGAFVAMMTTCRKKTIQIIEDLTVTQLDHVWDDKANSIAALLLHIAAIEVAYQEQSFFERNILSNQEKLSEWAVAMNLGKAAREGIKHKPIRYYLMELQEVREESLELFKKRDDDWFLRIRQDAWDNIPTNNYFRWWHTLEDEVNHRGQIAWLKMRIPH